MELPPFKAAIAAGVDAIMSTHIRLPALDPTPGGRRRSAGRSSPACCAQELGFDGLVFTDSMSMRAIGKGFGNEQAAGLAVAAGADVVLDPPDPEAALRGDPRRGRRGRDPRDQLDRSVERILRAKARLGLDRARLVDVEAVPAALGGRRNAAVADEIAARAITLVKDDRAPGAAAAAAGRPGAASLARRLRERLARGPAGTGARPRAEEALPDLTAVELTDRATAGEIDLVKALARRSDAVVAATFVRVASSSGRMDLAPAQQDLLEPLAADATRPFVAVAFGNPYVATSRRGCRRCSSPTTGRRAGGGGGARAVRRGADRRAGCR